MARPQAHGIKQFTVPTDFLTDGRMVAINVNFGAKGVAVVFGLLCLIAENGYWALWNDAQRNRIANQLHGVSPELVQKVVETCLAYDLFSNSLFIANHVLSSADIQRRYLATARRRKNPLADYALIEIPQRKSIAIPQPHDDIPQTPKALTTEAATPPPQQPGKPPNYFSDTINSQIFIENACMALHIDEPTLLALHRQFHAEIQAKSKQHFNIGDYRSHFIDWARRQTEKRKRHADRTNNKAERDAAFAQHIAHKLTSP